MVKGAGRDITELLTLRFVEVEDKESKNKWRKLERKDHNIST